MQTAKVTANNFESSSIKAIQLYPLSDLRDNAS